MISYRKQRGHRVLLEFAERQIEELENFLSKNREAYDASTQRSVEQSRRIAWLETRVRQPKAVADDVIDDSVPPETPKINMTERRHRVIALALRGQDSGTIATTLGILPGEVELIINLNQASINK